MKLQKKYLAIAATTCMLLGMTSAQARSSADNLEWPDLSRSYQAEGDFIQPDMVRRVKAGVSTKDEVRLLLNNPHFTEGYFGVREWDYVFNFYTGDGSEYVTCQYKVLFDKEMVASSTHWKNPACAQFVESKPVMNQSHPLTLSSDGLFAFGRSGFNDLQPTGRENLHNLAGQIKSGYKNLRSVDVVGYTDRIGSAESNMSLSIARANAVKQFLVSQGIPAALIRAQGAGEAKPVAFCNGAATAATIACLMPNRRIEVSVNGDI